ncbi:hypothetical protein OZ401_005092 (plasmid) [Candidatus Chlorohelix allophototropha]|uniref:Uncharacterized protein n=1 Tax=Candidatus Chlorohelix allophototropha TaxID=3003348 RepID=A0ABY9BBG4_9CHLR|nr:hypothetical protein OZ401_005092 [Chloroflexota bacterium L227-S17]
MRCKVNKTVGLENPEKRGGTSPFSSTIRSFSLLSTEQQPELLSIPSKLKIIFPHVYF